MEEDNVISSIDSWFFVFLREGNSCKVTDKFIHYAFEWILLVHIKIGSHCEDIDHCLKGQGTYIQSDSSLLLAYFAIWKSLSFSYLQYLVLFWANFSCLSTSTLKFTGTPLSLQKDMAMTRSGWNLPVQRWYLRYTTMS